MFDDLKNGIARPLAGMSLSFTASLFGLAGSLVMGFLDLQAGQAQSALLHGPREYRLATRTTPASATLDTRRRVAGDPRGDAGQNFERRRM